MVCKPVMDITRGRYDAVLFDLDGMEFLTFYGAEMLLEVARFWASVCTHNSQQDRYEILASWGRMSITTPTRIRTSRGWTTTPTRT